MKKYDVVVIGGGPGGYPAAIRAAQLGLSVAIVEMNRFGGECTNFGCIPTKSMIKPVEAMWYVRNKDFFSGEVSLDFQKYMEWVKGIVGRLSNGVRDLLKGNGVDMFEGRGRLLDRYSVSVDGSEVLQARSIILATGTSPSSIPGVEVDGEVIHNNRTIMGLKRKPSSILIIGGGYIGVEFASMMSKIGVEVYLVEIMDRLLPGMDSDFSRFIERKLRSYGVKVFKGTKVDEVKKLENGVRASLSNGSSIDSEIVLVAVGRKPNTSDLGLEAAGVETDPRGFIRVDGRCRTNIPNIYAVGDVTGGAMLAHRAFMQGVVAAENAAGLNSVFDARGIPAVVFTDPELAYVGVNKEEASAMGIDADSVRIPLGGVARAIIDDSADGFIKVTFDRESKAVLGVHVAAHNASEIISEATLAIEMGATLEDLALTIHPHPTISESIKEVADVALGKPLHYLIRRRG